MNVVKIESPALLLGIQCKGKKVKIISYIALYPVLRALHFTPWQTCSFQYHRNFPRKHSAMLQLLREDYTLTCPPMSVARYSFIQLSELWQCGVNEIAKASKWQQGDSNQVLSIESPMF